MKTTCGFLLTLLAVVPLCACDGLLPKRPMVQLYEIAPVFASSAARGGGAALAETSPSALPAVVVDEIEASGLTATDRIPVVEDGYRLSPLAGAQWERRAPLLAQDAIVRALEASGRARLVARSAAGLAEGFVLAGELRRMRAEMHGVGKERTCLVDVAVSLRLSSLPSRTILRARSFEARVPAQTVAPDALVAAFNRAWEQIAPEVVAWAVDLPAAGATAAPAERGDESGQ